MAVQNFDDDQQDITDEKPISKTARKKVNFDWQERAQTTNYLNRDEKAIKAEILNDRYYHEED